jgi:hypothetical protein
VSDRSNLARKMIKGNRECMVGFYDQAAHDRIIQEKNIENAMAGAWKMENLKCISAEIQHSSQKIVGRGARALEAPRTWHGSPKRVYSDF